MSVQVPLSSGEIEMSFIDCMDSHLTTNIQTFEVFESDDHPCQATRADDQEVWRCAIKEE